MDPLAAAREHARHGILGEPVDLALGLERAQLARDRDVAPCVAEPDRRGHEERTLGAAHAAPPRRSSRGPAQARSPKSRSIRLKGTGWRACGQWPTPRKDTSSAPVAAANAAPRSGGISPSSSPWVTSSGQRMRPSSSRIAGSSRSGASIVSASVSGRPSRPHERVLDLLGGVRLREAAPEEELEVAAEVLLPEVPVGLRPALVLGALLLEVEAGALGQRRGERESGSHEHRAGDALRVVGREQQRAARDRAVGDEHAARGAGGVEHGERVLGVGPRAIVGGAIGPVGAPVAASVVGDHPEVPGEVGDLALPEAGVDDRPGREQEQGLLALAEHLVREADTAGLGEAGLAGAERARRPPRCPPPASSLGGGPSGERVDVLGGEAWPPMPQSPLLASSMTTQVTPRMFSPSISTIVSVSFSIISRFVGVEDTLDELDVDQWHSEPPK